ILAVKGMFDPRPSIAILLIVFQFLLITAIAVLFSCLSSPILASVLTLALWAIGHLLWSLRMLEARTPSAAGRALCRVLYVLLPNFANFDVKGEVVHGLSIAPGLVGYAALYLVLYGSAVLTGACLVFDRKDLQ